VALLTRRISLAAAAAIAVGIVTAVWVARKPAAPPEAAALAPALLPGLTLVNPPATLPAVTFKTLDGAAVTLAQFKGHPVVLNFWATWCGPCVKEMPELDHLAAVQGAGGIAVLAVSADRTGADAVKPFLAAHDVSHATILLDQGSDAVHSLGLGGFPTTLIIDGAGRLRGRLEGPAAWGEATGAVRTLTK
jgi:thiol-disulfide isomerase/thioredoxin